MYVVRYVGARASKITKSCVSSYYGGAETFSRRVFESKNVKLFFSVYLFVIRSSPRHLDTNRSERGREGLIRKITDGDLIDFSRLDSQV